MRCGGEGTTVDVGTNFKKNHGVCQKSLIHLIFAAWYLSTPETLTNMKQQIFIFYIFSVHTQARLLQLPYPRLHAHCPNTK